MVGVPGDNAGGSGDGGVAGVGGTPLTLTERRSILIRQQEQSRPNLSYLIFLSLLFFFLNNKNDKEFINSNGSTSTVNTYDLIESSLKKRELIRDGLANWLGVETIYTNTTTTTTSILDDTTNSTNITSIPIKFEPKSLINPILLPSIHNLMDRKTGVYFHQNITGFVRGHWNSIDMSLESLGLEETFNITTLKEVPMESISEDIKVDSEVEIVKEVSPVLLRRAAVPIESDPTSKNLSHPIQTHLINITETLNRTESRGKFNWKQGGKISFNLKEERSSVVGARDDLNLLQDGELIKQKVGEMKDWELEGPISYLKGDITFTSLNGNDEFVLDIEAVHFLTQGSIYGMATPSYVVSHLLDVPGLPAYRSNILTRSSKAAGQAVLKEYDRRLIRDRNEFTTIGVPNQNPFNQISVTGAPCVFTLYGSMDPLPLDYSQTNYIEYISNLYHPSGSTLKSPPEPKLNFYLYSNNCGLVLEGEGKILMSIKLWERASTFGILFGFVQIFLTLLLVRQMEWGVSPSSCAKVAYFTIGAQAAMDSYFFITTFTIGVVTNNRASLPLLIPAFFALISSVFFGTRYASNIKSATPSSTTTRITPPRPVPTPPPPPPSVEELTARAAERRAAGEEVDNVVVGVVNTPVVVSEAAVIPSFLESPSSDDVKYLVIGFSIGLIFTCIVIFYGWVALFICILYSYWLPQILHNIQRGAARLSLRKEYIIGMTLGRLLLPVYIWACPNNIAAFESSKWIYVLILYSTGQAIILLLQDSRLGSRFFINSFLLNLLEINQLEENWNYHPFLPFNSNDIENNLIQQMKKEDCPICFEPLLEFNHKSEEEDNENEKDSLLITTSDESDNQNQRWKIMIPPCNHISHTTCMERWLAIKSVCPVCRARLPSL